MYDLLKYYNLSLNYDLCNIIKIIYKHLSKYNYLTNHIYNDYAKYI